MSFTRSQLIALAVAIGGIALAVGGVLQVMAPHEGDQAVVDEASEYATLAALVVALVGIAPGFLALAEHARAKRAAIAAAAGTAVLGLTCITTLVNGKDLGLFNVLAPLTNAAWLFGSIALAVSLKRGGEVSKWIYIGLPLTWVATIPLSPLGGGLLAGAYWMAVAYLLREGALGQEAQRPSVATGLGAAKRVSVTLVVSLAAMAAMASAAHAADTYYASPEPGPGARCTPADPCGLEKAVESHTHPGDEVVVLSGTHDLGTATLDIPDGVNIHAEPGTRPTITGTPDDGPTVYIETAGARLADVRVLNTGSGSRSALAMFNESLVERVEAVVVSSSSFACWHQDGVIRDSVCRATGENSIGVGVEVIDSRRADTPTLRNVTAVSTGSGDLSAGLFYFINLGESIVVDAKNVIAQGETADVYAKTANGATLAVNLANSSYSSVGGDPSKVTPTDTNGNQSTAPLFADAAAGDFRQLAGSPTIDAGTADADNGSLDLFGQSRVLGSAIDIGADEFDPPPATGAAAASPAQATPAQGTAPTCKPKKRKKRSKKRKRRC